MHIIFGNYGKNTLALIQWASNQSLKNVIVAHVETGWAASSWAEHVSKGQVFAQSCGFEIQTLYASPKFPDMIIDRGNFPSQKFQWCAGFLKGLSFLQWADQVDSACEAIVLLGSRRADSRARSQLPERIEQSEHFGLRLVWYPLFQHDDSAREALLVQSGLADPPVRSLECHPCVHSTLKELNDLGSSDRERLSQLENRIQKSWLGVPDQGGALECFDMGCGAPFACGE